ncbi:hypothetical protein A9Q99_27725 [Gammaproteobacteria bacterium 45_16_T64]|nr:hypothetical protein A9Q99_27725 [Gammaproteobacteria bacterium 45_16_T64]
MRRFSLEDFEIEPIKNSIKDYPKWVKDGNESTLRLYESAVNEFNEIRKKIISGKKLKTKERKIVLLKIAKLSGVDKSLLNKRRKPKLVKFISDQNKKLVSLWTQKDTLKNTSGKKLRKTDLQDQNNKLKDELEELQQTKMKEYLEEAMKMEILNDHVKIAGELAEFKALYNDSLETIANLRSQLRKQNIKGV